MKLFDINVFDWGLYYNEGQSRVCLDAYPVHKGADGYFETNVQVDPARLELTVSELFDIGFMDTNDTWIHSDVLLAEVDTIAPRVYNWIYSLHNS